MKINNDLQDIMKKERMMEMTLIGILILGFATYGVICWISRGKDGGRHSK